MHKTEHGYFNLSCLAYTIFIHYMFLKVKLVPEIDLNKIVSSRYIGLISRKLQFLRKMMAQKHTQP